MVRAENFFTEEEKSRIIAAVREAESRTSGEIVPMVVEASYDYPRTEIVGGGFFALGGASLAGWALGGSSQWIFLLAFAILYLPCKWIFRLFPELKRRLIPPAEMTAEVEERAMVAFIEQGVHHTRGETGILILLSLFEHRVHVLADRGINAVVPPESWDEIVAAVSAGMREGRACDALCEAIRRCGDLLEKRFPRGGDDRDELPNLIL